MTNKKISYLLGRLLVKIMRLKGFSYSMINEDNIIDWLTGYKKCGTYIDIGAYRPDEINNTKLFYQRGWRGINIEPSKSGYDMFVKERPDDKNYNCAIGNGEIEYFGSDNESSGNTCDKNVAKTRGMKSLGTIKLKPLREIFEENGLTTVDFISMDVEGYEMEILKSNDWNKYRANVLCIEGAECGKYLKDFGYRFVFWDGGNSYYKSKSTNPA
jgi:FkbM family methyltransferase